MTSEPLRRNIRFQLLWIGATASALGSHLSALAFPLLTLGITGSAAAAGLVSTAHLVGVVLLAVPAGPLIDRWDRRRILIGCETARLIGISSVAVAVLVDHVTIGHLLVVAFGQGAAAALFNPARMVAVRAVVAPGQLRTALSQEEVRVHAAGLAGPPLGGLLFGVGRAAPFLVDAASYLVSLVCLVAARVPRRPVTTAPGPQPAAPAGQPTGPRTGMAGELAEAARWLWRRRFARAVCGFSLAVNVVTSGLLLPVVVLVTDRGGAPATVGAAIALMGAGGLVGAAIAARVGRLLPPGQLVLAFGWWFAALLPATTLPFGPLWPGLMLALVALVTPALTVTLQATVLSEVPDQLLGRIGSLLMVASLALAPLGPLLSGFLTEAFGPAGALIALGGALAVIAGAATMAPTLRRPPPPPDAAEPAVDLVDATAR